MYYPIDLVACGMGSPPCVCAKVSIPILLKLRGSTFLHPTTIANHQSSLCMCVCVWGSLVVVTRGVRPDHSPATHQPSVDSRAEGREGRQFSFIMIATCANHFETWGVYLLG